MTDEATRLAQIVAGDADAFGHWIAGAEPRVRASLASFAAQLDVEALVQECLLRVWQVAPRVVADGRPDVLVRLAIRIARNLALDELRRKRADPATLQQLEAVAEPVHVAPGDPRLRELIASCREKLPGKPAAALQARLDGAWRPDIELATELGMQLNTFLQNFTRARKLLAQCLSANGVDVEVELA